MADPVVHLTNGVPDSGTGNVTTLGQTLLDGANITIGAKADAAATATDTTAVSAVSLWKQISKTLQAAAGAASTSFFTKVTDGTSTAAVKAASTAPLAADPALVVAISPNSVNANGQTTMANSAPVVLASNQSTVPVTPAGNVAHAAADSGNPQKIGGRARSSEITALANDNRFDFITDLVGKQITLPYSNPENFVSGAITTAMTATTTTSLIAAPAAGLRNYLTTIVVSNAHATVGTDVIIQDGSGGTALMTIPAAAVYGGAVINLPVPLRQPTTATAIYCANVTTGASTKVSAVGYKGA